MTATEVCEIFANASEMTTALGYQRGSGENPSFFYPRFVFIFDEAIARPSLDTNIAGRTLARVQTFTRMVSERQNMFMTLVSKWDINGDLTDKMVMDRYFAILVGHLESFMAEFHKDMVAGRFSTVYKRPSGFSYGICDPIDEYYNIISRRDESI